MLTLPRLSDKSVTCATARALAFFYRSDPATDSREAWRYEVVDVDQGEDLADVEVALAARADVNVLGQLLDLSALSELEAEELHRAADARDDEILARILPLVPRVTTPGVDLDFAEAGLVARLKAGFDTYFAARGARLRWARSGGPRSAHEHGELGPAEEGAEHPELMRVAFGLFRDACRALGLVPRADHAAAGDYWVLADDPRGARGSVDLSPLNRSPEARGSLFRPLGGLTKDRSARKVLSPGSPTHGTPWTIELRDEGLRLWQVQEASAGRSTRSRGRQKAREPLPDLPQARQLPRLTAWVKSYARPGQNHDLRVALAGVLRLSGLARPTWIVEALSRGTGNLMDSRDAWETTDGRVKAGRPVKATKALRARVGATGLEELAWAIWQDLHARGSKVDYLEVVRRVGLLSQLQPAQTEQAIAAAQARLDQGAEGRERAVLEQAIARLRATSRCGRRARQHEACSCCGKFGHVQMLRCSLLEACASCAARYAHGYVEALTLPRRVDVAMAPYPTRKAAKKACADARRRARGEAEPIGFVAPSGGVWLAVSIGPSDTLAGRAVQGVIDFERGQGKVPADSIHLTDQQAGVARAWIGRMLLLRHVEARARLERGDAVGFLELLVELYRRKNVQLPRGPVAIAWPSNEVVRGVRRAAAQRSDDREVEEACDCPPDLSPPWKKRWRVLDPESRCVLLEGLRRPPSLVEAAELEDRRPAPPRRPRPSLRR